MERKTEKCLRFKLTLTPFGSLSLTLSLWLLLTLTHSDSLWLSLSSSPRRSSTRKVLARLSTSQMHSPSCLHCLLSDTPYTVETIRTPAVLNKTEARKHYRDRIPLPPSLIYRWQKIVSKYFPTDCCAESGRCKRWYIIAKRLTYCYSCRVIWGKWDHSSRSNNNTCGNIFGWKRKWKFRIFIQQLYAHKR